MKRNILVAVLALILVLGAIGGCSYLKEEELLFPMSFYNPFTHQYHAGQHEYTDDLPQLTSLEAYQGNVLLADPTKADFRYDVKKVYKTGTMTRVVDFPNGFYVDLPGAVEFDFSRGEGGIKGYGDGYEVLLTREASPYVETLMYLDDYINKYVGNPAFQESNNITLHEDTLRTVGEFPVRILSMTRNPHGGSEVTLNSYTYAYIMDAQYGQIYHRILIKAEEYNEDTVNQILESFTPFEAMGRNMTFIETKPILPQWNQETKEFYESLSNREDILWGVYNYKLITVDGMAPTMEELQQKLDYRFDLCMGYTYLMEEPPMKGLQEAYDDGKITEMTLQVCTIDHSALDSAKNPNFEVIDGLWDDQI
ncbi:MAG: hypothetical protein IJ367_00030, partial [Clostridia bacterium]|nr:hypothetical protein [Clostridia bacterium]